mmetsp:Transcript_59385/g.81117  ORF Transcript_59385/g.81117 Transcript_59385/m.81117 type:complete len:208 (+) Transcript_59385:337-960(+)
MTRKRFLSWIFCAGFGSPTIQPKGMGRVMIEGLNTEAGPTIQPKSKESSSAPPRMRTNQLSKPSSGLDQSRQRFVQPAISHRSSITLKITTSNISRSLVRDRTVLHSLEACLFPLSTHGHHPLSATSPRNCLRTSGMPTLRSPTPLSNLPTGNWPNLRDEDHANKVMTLLDNEDPITLNSSKWMINKHESPLSQQTHKIEKISIALI